MQLTNLKSQWMLESVMTITEYTNVIVPYATGIFIFI